ncbi:MAG: hypothetical protein R2751_18930 [Bacteroidales bacterium]
MMFSKQLDLAKAGDIEVCGRDYVINLGWRSAWNGVSGGPTRITLPAGKAELKIKVLNYTTVPALYVRGTTVQSDTSWWADPSTPATPPGT